MSPHRSRFVPARGPSTPGAGRGRACVPRVTGERPGAHERGPAPAGQPGARGRRATGKESRRRARVRGRASRPPLTRRRHPQRNTRPRDPLPRFSPSRPPPPPARPSRLTPCCLLLPAHPHAQPPPACRRPASGPPAYCLGCAQIYLAGRGRGGSSAKRWTPFLESPGVEPDLGRGRGGGLLVS